MYLGAASGTTVSHVSDIVGPVCVYLFIIVKVHVCTETLKCVFSA